MLAFLAIFSARFFITNEEADFKADLVQNPSRYILRVSKQVNKGMAYYLSAVNDQDEQQLRKAVQLLGSSHGFLSNAFYSRYAEEQQTLYHLIDEVMDIVRRYGLQVTQLERSRLLRKVSRIDRLVTRVEQQAWDSVIQGYAENKAQNQAISDGHKLQNSLLNILFFLFVGLFVALSLFLKRLIGMRQQLEQHQSSLLQSEGRLNDAQKLVHLGSWELDLTTGEAVWSEEQFHLLGYRPDGVNASLDAFMQAVHPDDRATVAAEIERSMSADERHSYQMTHRVLHGNGKLHVVEEQARTSFDDEGNPVRMFGTTLDITERYQVAMSAKRREKGLELLDKWMLELGSCNDQPQRFYDTVCEAVMEMVSAQLTALPLIGESGDTFTYHAAVGRHADKLLGQSMPLKGGGLCGWVASQGQGICVPDLRQDPRVIQELADELEVTTGLLTPLTQEGKIIGGLSAFRSGEPFDQVDEELINLFGQRVSVALENVQLLTTLEQRVEERTQALAVINKELESFSYSVSHDLRAPLRSIDGFSQALLEDYEELFDETGRDYLFRVRRASQRMATLIDDLLMLSRLTRRDMHCEEIDLSTMADKSLEHLQKSEPERQVTLTVKPGITAQADVRLMQILLDNLLGNAWKYTSHEVKAEIGFDQEPGETGPIFKVWDNGVGFDMAYADKLFGAFQRLHKSDEFEGTGIGLATVARIIHRHGGKVWAEGEVGRGAAFYFTLT
ncbi:MAG: PAS domain-containing protein [gamma proteobacterium endosymbiont of Lamellibrachia anaximandri]|nr:PAS domain-containing protein [gamma proteobacterium endosymbiont of Lamellibrachia anaximandri]